MTPPTPPVIASFFDRRSRKLSIHPITILSGLAQQHVRARESCRKYAVVHGYTHFAAAIMPGHKWCVFEVGTPSTIKFVHEAPTQEAAEMWLVHLG